MTRLVVSLAALLASLGAPLAQTVEVVAEGRDLSSEVYSDFHWRVVRIQPEPEVLQLDPAVHGIVWGIPQRTAIGKGPTSLGRVARELWLFDAETHPDSAALVIGNEQLAAWFSEHPPILISRVHTPKTYLNPDYAQYGFGQEYIVKVWSEDDGERLVRLLDSLDGVVYAHRGVDNCDIRIAGGPARGCYMSRRRARTLVYRNTSEVERSE